MHIARRRLLAIFLFAMALAASHANGGESRPGGFDAAERRLADCLTRAESGYFPPYGDDRSVFVACAQENKAYLEACRSTGHTSFDCRGAVATLVQEASPKPDPIDRRFIDCLTRGAQTAPVSRLALLTICRQERYGYEADCRRRGYDAEQCRQKAEILACAEPKMWDVRACRKEYN